MKIGVCIKSTPDTDTRIKIKDGVVDPTGTKWIISPYDQFALEKAVQLKTKLGGEVVLFTLGNKSVQKNVRDGLAVGGDRAVHVMDEGLAGADSMGIAKALAAAVKAEGIELLLCGKKAIDGDNQQVPSMMAEFLGWLQVSQVTEFDAEEGAFTATRAVGSGVEQVVKGALPVVVSAEVGLATPRYAKLPAIMKAKRKKIVAKSLDDLGLTGADVAPKAITTRYTLPAARPAGRILSGERADVVKELVHLLHNEAKVL